MSWLGLFPFRCDACLKRSYRFRRRDAPTRSARDPRGPATAEWRPGRPLLVDLLMRMVVGRSS
jgi:hypothetical protein